MMNTVEKTIFDVQLENDLDSDVDRELTKACMIMSQECFNKPQTADGYFISPLDTLFTKDRNRKETVKYILVGCGFTEIQMYSGNVYSPNELNKYTSEEIRDIIQDIEELINLVDINPCLYFRGRPHKKCVKCDCRKELKCKSAIKDYCLFDMMKDISERLTKVTEKEQECEKKEEK